jgi:hypothetical protein
LDGDENADTRPKRNFLNMKEQIERTLTFDAGCQSGGIGTLTIEPDLVTVAMVFDIEGLRLLKEMLGDKLWIADKEYRFHGPWRH